MLFYLINTTILTYLTHFYIVFSPNKINVQKMEKGKFINLPDCNYRPPCFRNYFIFSGNIPLLKL